MGSLANHQSNDFTKLLLIGDAKCLSGDTLVSVTRGRSKGKMKTLRELYQMGNHHNHNHELETFLTCDLGEFVGLNRMEDIIFSGVKKVYAFSTRSRSINATEDHRFLTDNGWQDGRHVTTGTKVAVWDRSGAGPKDFPRRAMIYSVQYHPHAHQHNIGDYGSYGRITKARAVYEANLNSLSLNEYVTVIRHDPRRAKHLQYVPKDHDVHHKDRDRTNDNLSNLEVLPEIDHIKEHDVDRQKAAKGIWYEEIETVDDVGMVDTYDVVMQDPHNNFLANGFVVHNSGKTGSLVSLVKAGYKLRILDFDNLLDILKYMVFEQCPEMLGNVEYRTLRDKRKSSATGHMIDGQPKAFINAIKMLDSWKYTEEGVEVDLGKPSEWGSDCILVLDSLSRLCDAAYDFREPLTPVGKSGERDLRAVYGDAQDAIENLLAVLTSSTFATNVIVIAHVMYMDVPGAGQKGFPQGVGQKLSPKIPQYFPSVVLYTNVGGKRTLQTNSSPLIDLSNPKPFAMAKSYPIETGLAQFFEVLREPPKVVKPTVLKRA